MLGVLKLAQCNEGVFTTANLKLLLQIAERISIALDNTLAYQEIHCLKERLVDENLALTEQLNNVDSEFGEIIGCSDAMYSVLKQVEMVTQSDSTVLILGDTGAGKELIAWAIHNLSNRNSRRMEKMNCVAMPAGLLKSDPCGRERGAFTGVSSRRLGRFELADKSSQFLDEVGNMPLELQPKLLRVLQVQEFERLGKNKLIQTDVRLIAATNRDLKKWSLTASFEAISIIALTSSLFASRPCVSARKISRYWSKPLRPKSPAGWGETSTAFPPRHYVPFPPWSGQVTSTSWKT